MSVSRGYPVQRDHRIGRNTDVHDHHDLKFVVPANLLGAGSSVESAVLSLTAQDTSRSVVSVKTTADSTWFEASLAYANAPVG